MHIDRDHRSETKSYPKEVYYRFSDQVCGMLKEYSWASSCVLIGSCAKRTVIPGWSDIDILLFVEDRVEHRNVLSVRESLEQIEDSPSIGITIDQISLSDLRRNLRIGSQPLGMISEVSQYGIIKFGRSPFRDININSISQQEIREDARLYIMSDLFNWRRRYLLANLKALDFADYTCKTYLRCLMRFSAPMTEGPFTYENRLEVLKARVKSKKLIDAMAISVEYRSNYEDISASQDEVSYYLRTMISNIDCISDLI